MNTRQYYYLSTIANYGNLSHAAQALEMGADAVLVNTAIAVADDPVAMARAFRMDSRPRRTADRQRFLFGFPGAGRGGGQTG